MTTRRFIASYERVLATDELDKRRFLRTEFLHWIRGKLLPAKGYRNVRIGSFFQELVRILAVEVEFDYDRDNPLFAAVQPRFDGWVVVQLKEIPKPISE